MFQQSLQHFGCTKPKRLVHEPYEEFDCKNVHATFLRTAMLFAALLEIALKRRLPEAPRTYIALSTEGVEKVIRSERLATVWPKQLRTCAVHLYN